MNPHPSGRGKGSYAVLLLVSAAAALLLHLGILFFFRPMEYHPAEPEQDRRFTVMVPWPSGEGRTKDPYGLAYYLKHGMPDRILQPSLLPEDGRDLKEPLLSEQSELIRNLSLTEKFLHPVRQSLYPAFSRELRDFPAEAFTMVPPSVPAAKTEKTLLPEVRVRTMDGRILPGIRIRTRIPLRKALRSTILSLEPSAEHSPPEIRVRVSCGDLQLDMAAFTAVSDYLASGDLSGAGKIWIVEWPASERTETRRKNP